MKIAYDGAYAPSAQQAACLRQTGEVYFGYLNTPGVYHPWTDADFAVVRAAGFTVIPVAFGIRDTSAMLAILECRRLGFTSCVVDCEANDNGAYLGGWAAAVRSAGITPILYGLPGICRAWAGHFVALWAARYGGDPGTNVFDTGIGNHQGWQWWNSHTECGASVDRSWVDDWFAGVGTRDIPSPPPTGETSDMTPQEISAVVKLAYRLAGSPNADATDPKGFGDQVDAVVSGAVNLHEVVNNILATGALAAGPKGDKGDQGVPGPAGPPGPSGASGSGPSAVAPHHHVPGDVQ